MAVASHSVAMKDPADRGFLWNEQLYAELDPAAVAGVTLHPYLHLGDAVTGEGPRAKGERQLAHGQQRRKIVVVEVGAGFNTPTVTRFPAEAIVREFGPARAALVRFNPSDHGVPTDLPRAVGIAQGWGVLGEIEQQLGLGGREGVGGPGSAAGSSTADARAASEARLLAAERPADECEPAVCCDWRQFLTSLRSSQA